MKWKLYLDDERYPTSKDWVIARNFDDAVWYVRTYGIPYFIAFDHDLGVPMNRTGYDFAKWFADYVLTEKKVLPDDFNWIIHSMNPIGAKNIQQYMLNFIKAYEEGIDETTN